MDFECISELFLAGYDASTVGSDGRPAGRLPTMVRRFTELLRDYTYICQF